MKEIYLDIQNVEKICSKIEQDIEKLSGKKAFTEFSLENSALIVTDFQEYFLNPESHAFIPSAEFLTDRLNLLISFFKKAGKPIIFTRHYNDPEKSSLMSVWWKNLMLFENPDNKIFSGLNTEKDRVIINKQYYDAFKETELLELLSSKNIKTLVICGVMANLCVESTARSAFMNGFLPIIPIDGIAAYNYEFHRSSCINLAFGFSKITTIQKIIDNLNIEIRN